jgi:hypothetical protein
MVEGVHGEREADGGIQASGWGGWLLLYWARQPPAMAVQESSSSIHCVLNVFYLPSDGFPPSTVLDSFFRAGFELTFK